jgi:hypothetical protein
MATAARAGINRLNAQSSTGPRTEEGKSRSSLNAVGHGLTAKSILLPHESAEEYNRMKEGLIESYRPANDTEQMLVDRIAQAYWRMKRCYGVERAFLENRLAAAQETDPAVDPEAALARLFVDKAESARIRLVMRYLGTAERAYYKAMADLDKAQAARRRQEREDAFHQQMCEAYAPEAPAGEPAQPPTRGFVSYQGAGCEVSLPMAAAAAGAAASSGVRI